MAQDDALQRKQMLRKEGQIEIPMAVDPARYFIGNIKWMDVVFTLPFVIISIIIIMILYSTGHLGISTFLYSFLPPILVISFLWIKHPDRRNISFLATIWWKIRFMNSKKLYEYTKEGKDDMSEDIRSQIGAYEVANDCIETLDNRLVKVIEVSNVNLSGVSERERNRIYSNYQTFLNNFSQSSFPIQIEQFSKPINLTSYLNWVREETEDQADSFKRLFAESYINKVNEIQKSKNMVSKARYISISTKVGMNKERSIENLNLEAERLVSSIENMLSDKHKLYAHILDNEALFQVIYASIDYDNAQINQSIERDNVIDLPFSIGKETYEREIEAIRQTPYEEEIK